MTSSTATRSASSASPTGRCSCPGPSPSTTCPILASPCPKGRTRPWPAWPLTAWGASQKRARPLGSTAGSWRSWPSNTAPSPAYASPPAAQTRTRQLTSGPIPDEPTRRSGPGGPLRRGRGELDSGLLGEGCQELVLEALVVHGGVKLLGSLVVPVAAADEGLGVVGGCEPGLGDVGQGEVVARAGAAHLGGHPAAVDRVREDVRPEACEGGHECGDEQLGVGVRARLALAGPVDAGEVGLAAAVHAAGERDVPRRRDEGGHEVRRGEVDRQDRTLHDAGVVDDGVELAQLVRLVDQPVDIVEVGEVADECLDAAVDEVLDG